MSTTKHIHTKQPNKTIMSTHVIIESELYNQPYDYIYTICEADPLPTPSTPPSVLGKRKFCQSFDQTTFDDDRYAQHIPADFFATNVGHLVDAATNKIPK